MHGGEVHAHSAGIGQGSEFVIRLPLEYSAVGITRLLGRLAEMIAKMPLLQFVRMACCSAFGVRRTAVGTRLRVFD